jgi:hypothetical protein
MGALQNQTKLVATREGSVPPERGRTERIVSYRTEELDAMGHLSDGTPTFSVAHAHSSAVRRAASTKRASEFPFTGGRSRLLETQ